MKREIGVVIYFWLMVVIGFLCAMNDKTIESAIFMSAAAVVDTLNLIAQSYFEKSHHGT